ARGSRPPGQPQCTPAAQPKIELYRLRRPGDHSWFRLQAWGSSERGLPRPVQDEHPRRCPRFHFAVVRAAARREAIVASRAEGPGRPLHNGDSDGTTPVSATEPDQAAREGAAPSHAEAHRLTGMQLVIAIAVLLVAGAAVGYALYGPSGVLRKPVGAPAWQPGAAPCRGDPLTHVHDPGRLKLVANCATVSGL